MLEDREEQLRLSAKVAGAFSPSAPIDEATLFSGRIQQVEEVINAVVQKGQHAIIYGERGVGKTSLANVLSDILQDLGLGSGNSVIVNCEKKTTFQSLWHQILRSITLVDRKERMGFTKEEIDRRVSLEALLPKGEDIAPDDIRFLFEGVSVPTVIIDEMDRITDQETTTLIADTVKTLSDHAVNTTLILVGVADSVDDLITEHSSIERALVQIGMPRMSNEELFEIINKAFSSIEMTVEDSAKWHIAKLSQGLPHFTHLLGQQAGQQAVGSGRTHVIMEDVTKATGIAVSKADQTIVSTYHSATNSPRENVFAQVLLACALTSKDELGYFAAADVRKPLSDIMGKPYDIPAFGRHLNDFCDGKRGPILQKTGEKKRFRYRFINPMMEPFVTMNGLARGFITEETLAQS
jgi:energy-coupling factor transporter ATP-binding protein EcfA2